MPTLRQQAELREALGVDISVFPTSRHNMARDDFGWIARPPTSFTSEQVQQMTHNAVEDYATTLTQPELAPKAVRTLQDVVRLCQRERIAVALFLPPEASPFRQYAPEVAAKHLAAVTDLARAAGVPLIDGMAWVDDAGFYDGHHTFANGAVQFTERFRREALAPLMPRPNQTAASSVGRGPL
jgi:hypothetical protein